MKKEIKFKNKAETLIISGFPGIGKSFLTKEFGNSVSDSDSSKFDKKDFPKNYIKHIKDLIGKKKIILVSSHKEVLDELEKLDSNFIIISPERELKEEYIQRYKDRGSSEEFVKLLTEKWNNFIDDVEKPRKNAWKIKLKKGEFLKDYFN